MRYRTVAYFFIALFSNQLRPSDHQPSAPPANMLMDAQVFSSYNLLQQATIMQGNKVVGAIVPAQQFRTGDVIGFGTECSSRQHLPDTPNIVYRHNRRSGSFHTIGQVEEGQVSEFTGGQLKIIRRENYIESFQKCWVSLYKQTEAVVSNESARAFGCFAGSTLSAFNLIYVLVGSHNPLVAALWLSTWCASVMVATTLKNGEKGFVLTAAGSFLGGTVGLLSAVSNKIMI